MSVPPAAGTMLLGTLVGEWIRRDDVTARMKVHGLAIVGAVLALGGFLWAFDFPFNKPRWSPAYLVYTSGVLAVVLALFYWIVEVRQWRCWTYVLVVLGVNAIAAYFIPILAKVLLLNTPRVTYEGARMPLINAILNTLKSSVGSWAGGWTFTIAFVGFW